MSPTVSIIVVNYNRRDLLAQCLKSIENCSGQLDIEIIIIDNASTDDSTSYTEKHYPQVKLVKNKTNRGFSAANNQAIAIASGRYVLFLNSDTVIYDGSIEALLAVFKKHPRTGLCAPKLLNTDGSIQKNVYHFPTFKAIFARYTFLKYFGLFKKARDFYRVRDFTYDKLAEIDRPMGAAMLTSKKILEEVGPMDESFFFYFEDVDICKRIKDAGYKIYFAPESLITHHGQASSASLGSNKTLIMFFESMFYYFRKHSPRKKTFLFALAFKPAVLIYVIIEMLLGVLRGLLTMCLSRKSTVKNFIIAKQACLFLVKYSLRFIFC
ncbi:MAG: glycosyltransferase family 2 protein [Anaerohalosphaeraceae bacterium]|nr:glycosyltransferase family 2 protein [Anaerohalosphaeraceae bacterium]